MSDSYIAFVPADPLAVPSPTASQAVAELVRELFPEADDVRIDTRDEVVFRDCGSNFEGVTCPSCGADVMDAWSDLMDSDLGEQGFLLRRYVLPCCGAQYTLNELDYHLPQAFSRWEICARNPGEAEVDAATVTEIERLLGTAVRVLHRHL